MDVLGIPVVVVVDFLGAPSVDAGAPRVELIFGLMTPLSLALSTLSLEPIFGRAGFGMPVLAVPGLAVVGGFFKASEVLPAIGIDPMDGLLLFKKLLTGAVSGLSSLAAAVVFGGTIGPLALFGAAVEGFEMTLGFFRPKPVPILLAVFFRVDVFGVPIPMVDD